MTTDITELAPAIQAAAEKATPGQWVAFTHADSRTFSVHTPDDKRCGDVVKWAGFDGLRKAKANAEFIALANPANVLALVEALEKAQQRIFELESKLALPVQLPKTNGYWTETEKAYEEAITLAKRQIRLAGFRCEGDE
ncbi:TPA: ead/Ea22-like family protein [Klebsiella pneumoniae]